MAATAAQTALASKKHEALFSSPGKRNVVLCLLLAVLTLLLYNPVTHCDFVNYDDDHYVFDNAYIRAGLSWNTVSWAFRAHDAANWHPLTWLSHALDYQLFRMNPAGHHYTSALLHALNVVLLFLVLQAATGFAWRSLMVAALFAVHPLNVESVAWVAERKNILCTLFFLLTLAAYGWYVRQPHIKRYGLVALLFALGLMAKPMVITLPFVLLLLDYWPHRRMGFETRSNAACASESPNPAAEQPFLQLAMQKVPLLMLSVASGVVTMWAQKAGGAISAGSVYSFPVRIKNAAVAYVLYLSKTVWPSDLAVMYPHPGNSLAIWKALVCMVLLLLISGGVLVLRKQRYLTVGWFWYLGMMVPVVGLVQVGRQAMSDRYAYLPLIGVFIIIVWGVAESAAAWKIPAKVIASAAILAIACLSAAARVQLGYWHDSVSLWTHTLAVTQGNFVAHDNLGEALVTLGRYDDAIGHFRTAAQIEPNDPIAQINIGVLARRQERIDEAIERYQQVLRLTGDPRLRAYAFTNLGSAYRTLHKYPQAIENYDAALQLSPDTTLALLGLGLVAQNTGDLNQAIQNYSRAMRVEPTDVGYLLLARALQQSGRFEEAQAAAQQARRMSKNLNAAQQTANKLLLE